MAGALAQGVAGVQGLQGTAPQGFVIGEPEATAEQRQGGYADPRHAILGETQTPYPWEAMPGQSHGPYGAENGLLGDIDMCSVSEPAGMLEQDPTADLQPVTHAANWPKGVPQTVLPDEVAARRQTSANIHAVNMGASREALYIPTIDPQNDQWAEILETDPGLLFPAMQDIPGQIKTGGSAGWGSRDRIQSYAGQNQYGFDSAHMHRRYAIGSIPGNYMWLEPGSRPLVKTIAGPARLPTGADSPFTGQDPSLSFNPQGAALMTLPASYSAPPDVAVAQSFPDTSGDAAPVDFW